MYINYELSSKLTTVQVAEAAGQYFNHLLDTSLVDRWGADLVQRTAAYWEFVDASPLKLRER